MSLIALRRAGAVRTQARFRAHAERSLPPILRLCLLSRLHRAQPRAVAVDAATAWDWACRAATADLGPEDRAACHSLILTHCSPLLIHRRCCGRAWTGYEAISASKISLPKSSGCVDPCLALSDRKRRAIPGASIAEGLLLISERTSLVVGDTEFVLIPVRGGETRDALMGTRPPKGRCRASVMC